MPGKLHFKEKPLILKETETRSEKCLQGFDVAYYPLAPDGSNPFNINFKDSNKNNFHKV